MGSMCCMELGKHMSRMSKHMASNMEQTGSMLLPMDKHHWPGMFLVMVPVLELTKPTQTSKVAKSVYSFEKKKQRQETNRRLFCELKTI